MTNGRLFFLALFVTTLAGCAGGPLVESGGFKVHQEWLDKDIAAVRPRAAFDLGCAAEQLQLVVVAVTPDQDSVPSQIGASGCGKRSVYIEVPGGSWVKNSETKSEAAGAQ